MTLRDLVRAALLADPAVVALVVDRVGPAPLPQKPTLPAVTLQTISDPQIVDYDGVSVLRQQRIQVNQWATTAAGVTTLRHAVEAALARLSTPAGRWGDLRDCLPSGGGNDTYDDEVGCHGWQSDYLVKGVES